MTFSFAKSHRKLITLAALLAAAFLLSSCGGKDNPPDSSLPEPTAHDGAFTSEYGTMTFNGDGESITFDFTPEFSEAAGLPVGEQSGSYVFLFQHKEWRYDKAERFRITASESSYDFVNVFTETDENTIALQSPLEGAETIRFKKTEK